MVRQRSRRDLQVTPNREPTLDDDPLAALDQYVDIGELSPDPGTRARQLRQISQDYSREFVLETVNRMSMAGVPLDSIAKRFNVSVSTVYRWRKELKKLFEDRARNINPMSLFAETTAHYKALREEGWRIAMNADNPSDKRRGLDLAMNAENNLHTYLEKVGFYDHARITPKNAKGEESNEEAEAKMLTSSLRDMMETADLVSRGEIDIEDVEFEEVPEGNEPLEPHQSAPEPQEKGKGDVSEG